jgi:hypothetical protein
MFQPLNASFKVPFANVVAVQRAIEICAGDFGT